MILLDTCALLWLASSQKQLTDKAVAAIKNHSDALFVSSISALEIAIKAANKKLALPEKTEIWYSGILRFHGLIEIPVNGKIAARSAELPLLHNDPFDRIIIATAIEHKLKIVTSDQIMKGYKAVHCIW